MLPPRSLAGDPMRYADRASWPEWASVATDPERFYPEKGELVDAIHFELIRGYPVKATDPLGYEDREFRFYQPMTRAEFATVLSRSLALTEDGPAAQWYQPHTGLCKSGALFRLVPAATGRRPLPGGRRGSGWAGRPR